MACKCSLVPILWFESKHNDNNDDCWDENCFQSQPSLYLLCEDDLGIELGSHGCRLFNGPHWENDIFCIYSKSIPDMWAGDASNWCFWWRTETWGKEKMWKSQTQHCTSLDPRGSVSPTTPPQTGVPWRELNSCSLLGRAGHQVAHATASRVVGWKVNFWSSYLL